MALHYSFFLAQLRLRDHKCTRFHDFNISFNAATPAGVPPLSFADTASLLVALTAPTTSLSAADIAITDQLPSAHKVIQQALIKDGPYMNFLTGNTDNNSPATPVARTTECPQLHVHTSVHTECRHSPDLIDNEAEEVPCDYQSPESDDDRNEGSGNAADNVDHSSEGSGELGKSDKEVAVPLSTTHSSCADMEGSSLGEGESSSGKEELDDEEGGVSANAASHNIQMSSPPGSQE